MKIYTNWTQATTDISKAMIGLVSCLESGHNAWIEIKKNGEQDYPIQIENPELDNPFNWTMMYGVPRNEKELMEKKYFNDTEKDLTYNWSAVFGNEEAIKRYQENGEITKGLCLGMGRCHPIRNEDANKYRAEIIKDDYKYNYWVTIWKPKDKIPYWIVDTSIDKVFTICYDNEPCDKNLALSRAGQFLIEYSKCV